MKIFIHGEILNLIPIFKAYIKDGVLIFNEEGDISLTVDTGFNGGITLPQNILDELNLEFIGYDTFTIGTGDIIELPMFLGNVLIKDKILETWFIPGDSLVGTEFLYAVGKILRLDFEKSTVKLSG
jgi:predicted aspartyl protease